MLSVTLTSDWGRIKAGAEFRVLQSGEPIKGRCVDPQRAAQLVADGLAVDADGAPPKKKTKKKTKKKAVKSGD